MFQLTSEEISMRPHMAEILVPPSIADLYRDGTEAPADANNDEAKATETVCESSRAESKHDSNLINTEMSKLDIQESPAPTTQNVRQSSLRGEIGSVKADEN